MQDKPTIIEGIHHITAITGSAARNLQFYSRVLGLRLVKKTVNFDDPYTYHLYYGDAAGTPGTILTFFPWEHLPPGTTGSGMVTSVAFAVAKNAVDFWSDRLRGFEVEVRETERFGEPLLQFNDPDGLGLELIGSPVSDSTPIWEEGPVSSDHAVMGIHSAAQKTRDMDETRALLTQVMGMTLVGIEGRRHRFRMPDDRAPGRLYDLVAGENLPAGRQGAGTVHHIAFRTPSDDSQSSWQALLREKGLSVTPVRDRAYFRSIYFREPGGVLFEIATDGPGFAIDEAREDLGRTLKLPPELEPMRFEIERRLPLLRTGRDERRINGAVRT